MDNSIVQDCLKINQSDALSRLAYKLWTSDQSVVINRNCNEIIRTDRKTQQKTIYRFLSPDELGLKPPLIESNDLINPAQRSKKLGRPRKRTLDDNSQNVTDLEEQPKKACVIENSNEPKINPLYSRFGRAIKRAINSESFGYTVKEQEENKINDEIHDIISKIQDKDFICNLPKQLEKGNEQKKVVEPAIVPIATSSPTKRHVPPESICPTCKKIFLGRRLKRHFVDYPGHMKPPESTNTSNPQQSSSPSDDVSLFRFLVSKLQRSNLNEDQKADLFLHEINDLVEQLQLRSSRLIRNTSGLHLVTSRTARVLGIPEGQYALDIDLIATDTVPEPEPSCPLSFDVNSLPVPMNNTRSLDYTALSLDDTLTDEAAQKLNLSAGGKLLPPSEESLLRAVDDFVPPTGITKLVVSTNLMNQSNDVTTTTSSSTVETMVPNYDHASDNAVEAVTMKESDSGRQAKPLLDLTVDFFQFNKKK